MQICSLIITGWSRVQGLLLELSKWCCTWLSNQCKKVVGLKIQLPLRLEEAMKRLYLIRHAKSSWADPELDDFHRPLNRRGNKDGPEMAKRLAQKGIRPDLIVASPAVRAKSTAEYMAAGCGYDLGAIQWERNLYLGSLSTHCRLLQSLFKKVNNLFLVGHNETMTELAEHLSGRNIGNIPTCGIVALEYSGVSGFSDAPGSGEVVFFWFPKDQGGG